MRFRAFAFGTTSATERLVFRLAPPVLVLLAAGCPFYGAETSPMEDDGITAPGGGECVGDGDCAAASSACCECPSFALPVRDDYGEACGEIPCDPPASCPDVVAACEAGTCVLRCAAIPCDLVCEGALAVDSFGCTTCSCTAAPAMAECADDAECIQVPADCCGCSRGGADVAVLASEAESFAETLDCPGDPVCPDVDVCMGDYSPQCISGSCRLAPTPDVDTTPEPGEPARCGTTEWPPCPAGQVCMLNDPEANGAGESGVGVCREP